MYEAYIKLSIVAALPVFASIMFALIKKGTNGSVPYWLGQIAIGITFGGIAVLGTEWGIPLETAVINCRDAAPMAAGLIFGAPAGIIAGLIGGVERWIAVAWGVGSYTRVACSVSTALAGIYSAVLRKYMFEDKHPSWLMSFSVGIVIEVFHLSMVFLTHMDDSARAMEVVRICSVPMVLSCGLSVLLATMMVTIIESDSISIRNTHLTISQSVQRYLLIAVILIFAGVSYFSLSLNNQMADAQTDTLLTTAIDSLKSDLEDASDNSMLDLAYLVRSEMDTKDIRQIAEEYDIDEINVCNKSGIIVDSTNKSYIGFDFNSGAQSVDILKVLKEHAGYAQKFGPISYDHNIYMKYVNVNTKTGFIQVGYDADSFYNLVESQISGSATNRIIGDTGFVFVLDSRNRVITTAKTLPIGTVDDYIKRVGGFENLPGDGVMYRDTFLGEDSYMKYSESEGYHIVGCMPAEEALKVRNTALYANTYMYILMFAVMFAMIFTLIKGVVVKRIQSIKNSLTKISSGDLDVVVNVRQNEEFDTLSNDINSTVDTLKRYIDEAAARIDADLAMAKAIQSSALPSSESAIGQRKEFNIWARMDTAKEVGGDFYDFYMTHTNTLNFLIADVSGKGIPAAMFMMRAKAELKSLTETDAAVNDVFTRGNSALCEGNDNGMFVTAWQGQINLETGLVNFANAGHNPPLVKRANGEFEYLKSKVNLVLAGMDGVPYKNQELQLEKGDEIFLYTDGITEATDAHNELYGEDRLLACLNANKDLSVHELCDKVKEDVDAFVKEAPQFDDMTMLAFKFIGKPESPSIAFDEAKIEDIPPITEWAEEKLAEMGCPMKAIIAINIAIDELYSNIVKYAYGFKPGPAKVMLTPVDGPNGVLVSFIDEGIPYNPIKAEDPDTTLDAEARKVGGLGIFMVKKSMDEMSYEYKDGKNILKIRKNF